MHGHHSYCCNERSQYSVMGISLTSIHHSDVVPSEEVGSQCIGPYTVMQEAVNLLIYGQGMWPLSGIGKIPPVMRE